jgi:CubicO group peptidase (beta-lactamase class C family)
MNASSLMFPRLSRRLATLGCAMVAVTSSGFAELDMTPLQEALDQWAGDRPGTAIALVVNGDEMAWVSAGRWTTGDDRQADVKTLFEIGSITKVFTALLAAEAVGEGVLAWDDPVGTPFEASPITYAQLATHTSGLPRLPRDFGDVGATDPYAHIGREQLVESFSRELKRAKRKSGKWEYSNIGAAVLGEAVGATLGKGYAVELRARVLAPIGMEATWLSGLEPAGDQDRLAPGHAGGESASAWHFQSYAPAGALVSSAWEMGKFIRLMLGDEERGLPSAWAETMTQQAEMSGGAGMGYGWLISPMKSGPVYWHNGGTGGYRSFVGVQPATHRGIVILGASENPVEGIGLGWLQGLLTGVMDVGAATGAFPGLEDYVGDYPLAPNFVIKITIEDGKLHAQATRQPRLGLTATGPDAFKFDVVTAALSFERDESGEVVALVLHQNGADQRAPRHESGTQEPARRNLEMTAGQLAPLVGEYELAPGAIITITAQGSQLFAQLTGQQNFPVFASAPDVFFYEVVEAELHFERDGDGQVTRVVLH